MSEDDTRFMSIKYNVEEYQNTIEALQEYVKDPEVDPLISILEALKQDADNKSLLLELNDAFNRLGIIQGAVLTYAPHISYLLSSDLFGDN